jgi:hypothetical protein
MTGPTPGRGMIAVDLVDYLDASGMQDRTPMS